MKRTPPTSGLRLSVALVCLIVAACLIVNCGLQLAGGTSTTDNPRVVGIVIGTNNEPATHTRVTIIPDDYNLLDDPPLAPSSIDTTDEQGRFEFIVSHQGVYNIQAVQLVTGTRSLVRGIAVLGRDTTISAPDDTLKPFGAISVVLPDSVVPGEGYLYIPGTTIARFCADTMGSLTLDSVPAGTMPSIIYGVLNTTVRRAIRHDVQVSPGTTTIVSLPAWQFARQLILNTTSTGADVAGSVTDFPALVRLTSANFNFSEAQGNGGDLRFSKANGTPLVYEIEQWDSATGTAAIWVKVDTVYGNNETQSISMLWGNANAASGSNSTAVFDTANGFQGVWHMAQSQGEIAHDATGNHFDGAASDSSPQPVAGAIGMCQQFDGTSNYIRMPGTASGKLNFPENGTYSVGAWVYVDTLDSTFSRIVEKNDCQYKLQKDGLNRWEFSEYESTLEYEMTTSPASAKAWVYLVGVRWGGLQYLYVNGICVNNVISPLAAGLARDTTTDVTIGWRAPPPNPAYPGFFKGKIDEVRIENRALSPDWIKLCYMNQKAQDALILTK